MSKLLLVIALVFLVSFSCLSQDKYTVNFYATGKIQPPLPEKIGTSDFLGFRINDLSENFDLYKKNLKDRASKSLQCVNKLLADAEKKKVLDLIFDITDTELNNLKAELEHVLADQLYNGTLTYIPVYKIADKKYYHINVDNITPPTSDDFEPNTSSVFLATKPVVAEKELDFTLTKTDPFAKLTLDWLNSTKNDYAIPINFASFSSSKKELQDMLPTITGFLNRVTPRLQSQNGNFRAADIPFLTNLINSARILTNNLSRLTGRISPAIRLPAYKDWILKWLWYQNNELPQMNPFQFKSEKDMGVEPDTSALAGLRFKIGVREDFYKTANLKKYNAKQLDSLINETDSLKKRLGSIQKASQLYLNIKSKNDNAIQSLGTTISQLNVGILFPSDASKKIYWMRHHDASSNYQLINDIEKGDYTEDDRVLILGHNLKPNEKSEIHISFQDITNDASQLSEQVQKVLEQIAPLAQTLLPRPAANIRSKVTDSLKLVASNVIDSLKDALTLAQALGHCLDYLVTQTNPITDVQQVTVKSSTYHSQVINPAKKIEGPKKATYYINTTTTSATGNTTGTTVADTFTYRVNKLYRIFPMAGIGFTATKLNYVTQDSALHQSKNETDSRVSFIIGAKIYLKKIDIRNPKFFTGKDNHGNPLWKSRTSITIAFDASKPLDNIYIGPGLDLWPGFSINAGWVFNKYIYNVYSIGLPAQPKNLYRPGFYIGVSTDISFFSDIAKFLNLSK